MGTDEATTTSRLTILDNKTLSDISARLYARAETITQICLTDLAMELRLAGRCAEHLATIRQEVSEIAAKTSDAETRRELRDLVTDVEF